MIRVTILRVADPSGDPRSSPSRHDPSRLNPSRRDPSRRSEPPRSGPPRAAGRAKGDPPLADLLAVLVRGFCRELHLLLGFPQQLLRLGSVAAHVIFVRDLRGVHLLDRVLRVFARRDDAA